MTKEKTKKAAVNSDENSLSLYLKEISRIPLLSREEEDVIAREAAKGNMAARNRLVNANLRFVVKIAKKFQGQGLPLADLISEGNIGLMRAIKTYDADRGCHFITYAVYWIRQVIQKAIHEKSRMIRLPIHKIGEVMRIEKTKDMVQDNHTNEAENLEVARLLDMDISYIAETLNSGREPVSLESPVFTSKDAASLGSLIEDKQSQAPDEYAVECVLQQDIEMVLSTLDRKEAEVIRFRYGLGSKNPMSLKEVGKRLNLSRERVRQIENRAMKRLQNPLRQRMLASYVA